MIFDYSHDYVTLTLGLGLGAPAHGAQPSGTRTPCSMHAISILYEYSNGTQYRQSVRLLATSPRPCSCDFLVQVPVQGRTRVLRRKRFWRSCEFRRGFRRWRRRGFRRRFRRGFRRGRRNEVRRLWSRRGRRRRGRSCQYGRRSHGESRVQRSSVSGAGKVGAGACLRPHVVRVRSLPRQSLYTAMCPVPLLCVKSEAEVRHVGCAPRALRSTDYNRLV